MPCDEREPKMATRQLPLDAPLVAGDLAKQSEMGRYGSVMLHPDDKKTFGRRGNMHYRLRRDAEGRWYIRYGKRGACSARLASCQVVFFDGEPSLFQYRLSHEGAD